MTEACARFIVSQLRSDFNKMVWEKKVFANMFAFNVDVMNYVPSGKVTVRIILYQRYFIIYDDHKHFTRVLIHLYEYLNTYFKTFVNDKEIEVLSNYNI